MCTFYKRINEIFKNIFEFIFITGILGLIFGFIYFIYVVVFNHYEVLEMQDNIFVFEYIACCMIAIFFGVGNIGRFLKEKS